MTRPPVAPELDHATRRALAIGLFNYTWTLLENPDRTPEQDDEMLHAAHASRYHWGEVGEPANLVLLDPSARAVVDPAALASKSRNSPYAGRELPARVVHTLLRGELSVLDGKVQK